MDCPTCQQLAELVAKTSRDWAFAEQLAEVGGRMPELVAPSRRKADSAHQEYDLAVQQLAGHREQCSMCNSAGAIGSGGTAKTGA